MNSFAIDGSIKRIVEKIANDQRDVIVYSEDIIPPGSRLLHNSLKSRLKLNKNVFLHLSTLGGLADEAYRIVRCLQNRYTSGKILLFVNGYCKSAGTLMALGAHEIIMSDTAELGPLDVQISKRDEIGERTSGLTPGQAIETLQYQSFNTFSNLFTYIHNSFGDSLSTQSITNIATQLTIGCFGPLYQQIDPMRLTEFQRSVLVAKQYGLRLSSGTGNLKSGTIDKLIAEFL